MTQHAISVLRAASVAILIGHCCVTCGEVLDAQLHHLRQHGQREWSEFPEQASRTSLEIAFDGTANLQERTLRLRQQDVKQRWRVQINDRKLGELIQDENDLVLYLAVPAGAMNSGRNVLRIDADSNPRTPADDIRVGEIEIDARPVAEVLRGASLAIRVIDADSGEPLPARITIVNTDGALQTTSATTGDQLAVRPGTIYTANGTAEFGVPPGTYTIYAGRGFEYSLAQQTISIQAGQRRTATLTVRREVPTEGYVACDTHIHSLTHSGHGDATVQERMITLAAEGIELPVATDHNVHVSHDPFARAVGVRQYFTPVIGNEVTTGVGHFNTFPVAADARVPNAELTDWPAIFAEIHATTEAPVVILNHARDLHRGVRPFGAKRYHALVAETLQGWPIGFNAMEVVNSSATQNDPMQLFYDWMALLNRGHQVTPIGASDSHDVLRHFAGQARTYIRCDDTDVSSIDVPAAIRSLLAGHVRVSYGLLTELTLDGQSSGDIVPLTRLLAHDDTELKVPVRVLAPHWVEADQVVLFVNGQRSAEIAIPPAEPHARDDGVVWAGEMSIPRPSHDVHLVVIARGPGITEGYWRTAKPYQPKSSSWQPTVIGCSGAVWIDADGDGKSSSAYDYAGRLCEQANGKLGDLLTLLADYHPSVAYQALHGYRRAGGSLDSAEAAQAVRSSSPAVGAAVSTYLQSVNALERAQFEPE